MSLFDAIEDGDLRAVRRLLRTGVPVDQIDESTGVAPLALAAECGHLGMVQVLLRAGADPDWGGATTPLEAATLEGHLGVAAALIKACADVNRPVADGFTPLITAASTGNLEMVRMLIKAGAVPTVSDDEGETALTVAKKKGHGEVLAELQVTVGDGRRFKSGDGLFAAVEDRDLARIRECLKNGADLNATNRAGLTALARAAELGHVPIVRALLAGQADCNLGGRSTPLCCAVRKRHEPVVRTLIEAGSDVNAPGSDDGSTALIAAAESGNVELVRLLLEAGADANLTDTEQKTALWAAATRGKEQTFEILAPLAAAGERAAAAAELARCVEGRQEAAVLAARLIDLIHDGQIGDAKRLLANGAVDPDGFDEEGHTALMIAAAAGHRDLLRMLISAGASFEVGDDVGPGWTALIHAIHAPGPEAHVTVSLLAAAGADPNHRCGQGLTPLMHAVDAFLACESGDVKGLQKIVEALFHVGANLEARDPSGRTVWMRVRERVLAAEIPPAELQKLGQVLRLFERSGARTAGGRDVELVMAAAEGRASDVRSLLRSFSDPQEVAALPAMALATANKHWPVVSLLVEAGVDIDSRDPGGMTVLMRAAATGKLVVVEQLVQAGADPTLELEGSGETAEKLATAAGHEDVARFLKNLGRARK